MAVVPINSLEDFKKIINSGKVVVIDFWATWCGPCRAISPVFETLSTEHEGVEFYKVDVDEQSAIAEEAGIRVMPSFLAYKDGTQIEMMTGAMPAALKQMIEKLAAPA